MSIRSAFWIISFIFMLALSVGDIVLIQRNPTLIGLGTHTILGKVITTVSIIFQSIFLSVMAVEFVVRAYLSSFGLPCSFMRREICCFEYRMPTFWKSLKIVSAVAFPIVTILAALLVFLDVTIAKWSQLNIPLLAVMVGVPLLEVILSSISHHLSNKEFKAQYPDEENAADEVPLNTNSSPSSESSPPSQHTMIDSPNASEDSYKGKEPIGTSSA